MSRSPEQLRAYAAIRQRVADRHAKDAVKWWREACKHKQAGNADTSEDFLKLLEVSQRLEQRALDDAMSARLEAARLEQSLSLMEIAA